ncbi:hypothetical protein [Micromonospora fulviviridis]|uniref:hypothetical protein n=1 Tax=Micromonospora fulviviridis TaxID=47860 RepID=UPI00379D3632
MRVTRWGRLTANGSADESSTGAHGSGLGTWEIVRPEGTAERGDVGSPEPAWAAALRTMVVFAGLPVTVTTIPAGFWVRSGDGGTSHADLANAVLPEQHKVTLLVGAPGTPGVPNDALRVILTSLPADACNRVVVTPFGPEPVAGVSLATVTRAALPEFARLRTGLPLLTKRHGPQLLAVDANGTPTWRPFVREIQYRGFLRAPSAVDWCHPIDGPADGLASVQFTDTWKAEVIAAGIWVRPVGCRDCAPVVRALPIDADWCSMVLGCAERPLLDVPWPEVRAAIDTLPSDARPRLRLVVADRDDHLQPLFRHDRDDLGVFRYTRDGTVRGVPTCRSVAGWWRARRGGYRSDDVFVEESGEAADLARLTAFLDQLRRTPSWDQVREIA